MRDPSPHPRRSPGRAARFPRLVGLVRRAGLAVGLAGVTACLTGAGMLLPVGNALGQTGSTPSTARAEPAPATAPEQPGTPGPTEPTTSSNSKHPTTVRYVTRANPDSLIPNAPIVIQGRVHAADREVPLSYTNVFIEGTGLGAMATGDGRFWLRGVRPGQWTVRAAYISYAQGAQTVTVRPGDVVEIDFWLEPQAWRMETRVVLANRMLLDVAETGTARRISGKDLESLPLDNVVEIVGLQPGVTVQDNEIHVRGARSDDTSFIVDGIGVKDPLAAGRYGVSFNEDLINEIEVLTGGFSAEYGQAVSGVVNVSTKEGSDRFAGKVTYKTDTVAPDANQYNTDDVRLTLSGPNPIWQGLKALGVSLPGDQYLIVSGNTLLSDTYLPTESLSDLQSPILGSFWSPRANNEWSGLAKLTWRFSPSHKLNVTYSNQQDVSQGYFLAGEGFPRKFQNILQDYNVFTSQNILGQVTWRQVLGQNSFYEINLGRQFSRLHSNKNGSDDFTTYQPPIPREHVIPSESEEPLTYTFGAYTGGTSDRWHDHYSETWTAKGDYAWMAGHNNQFKTGFEYSYTDMQLIDLQGNLAFPPSGYLARNQDIFRAHPHVAAAYLQDRLSYKGLILNLGLRFDAWAPGKEVDDVMSRPEDYLFIFPDMQESYYSKTTKAFGVRWKSRLSPRVGFSFPVSTHDKIFFNYGHFNQWPRYNYVYAQLETRFATGLQLLGNPDLDPKVTVQYEAGIQHEFTNLWSAELTFYSNDIYGYAQSVKQTQITIDPGDTPDPNDQTSVTVQPVRYFNADAARSIGIEMSLVKRATRWLGGRASFELQRSTGTNSSANATFIAARLGQGNADYETEQSIRNVPLLWDLPWAATLNLDFNVGKHDPPTIFGWSLPTQWSANILYRATSGVRYTELILDSNGNSNESLNTNGKIGPPRSYLNLKINKYWDLPNQNRFTMFLEGRNLLDHDNYRRVNPWTGQGYHMGNWDGSIAADRKNDIPKSVNSVWYGEDFVDPSYRTDPRTVLMGVSYQW